MQIVINTYNQIFPENKTKNIHKIEILKFAHLLVKYRQKSKICSKIIKRYTILIFLVWIFQTNYLQDINASFAYIKSKSRKKLTISNFFKFHKNPHFPVFCESNL